LKKATMMDNETEFVEKIRRVIAVHKRMRRLMKIFYSFLAISLILLIIYAFDVVRQLGAIPGVWQGFAIGVMISTSIGFLIVHISQGLLSSIFSDFRCQRLMVKYHDQLYGCDPAE